MVAGRFGHEGSRVSPDLDSSDLQRFGCTNWKASKSKDWTKDSKKYMVNSKKIYKIDSRFIKMLACVIKCHIEIS